MIVSYSWWSFSKIILSLNVFLLLLPATARPNSDFPQKAYIAGVHGHAQKYNLSCESRSAVDWAAYFGIEISEKKFLKNLPVSLNPEKGFVGNPADSLGNIPPNSYGVHAGPVANLLREFGLPARAVRDLGWDQLRSEISADRPVIIWVIGQMWKGKPVQYTSPDGETTNVAHFEHTMILVGYTPSSVIVIDSATGNETSYPLRSFFKSWDVLGRMAIIAESQESNPPPVADVESTPVTPTLELTPPPVANAESTSVLPTLEQTAPPQVDNNKELPKYYVVRRGEYLTGIAKRFGVNWRALARLNNLSAPYVLYTGQRLRIR